MNVHQSICLRIALLAALVPSTLVAQANLYSGFQPVQDYVLEVGGELDQGAKIYLQRRAPAYLILPSGSNQPLLLVPRSQAVQTVNVMKVKQRSDGGIDIQPDGVLGTQTQLEVQGLTVRFALDGTEYVLRDKPDLLGLHPASGLEDYEAEYGRLAEAYKPNGGAIDAVSKDSREVRVRVYFGSWCPFCQQYLPRMMKVGSELAESGVKIDYYGLPKRIGEDPVSQQMNISAVPTGVVFVDGKEAGRINNDEWRTPEEALQKILADA